MERWYEVHVFTQLLCFDENQLGFSFGGEVDAVNLFAVGCAFDFGGLCFFRFFGCRGCCEVELPFLHLPRACCGLLALFSHKDDLGVHLCFSVLLQGHSHGHRFEHGDAHLCEAFFGFGKLRHFLFHFCEHGCFIEVIDSSAACKTGGRDEE